MSKTGLPSDLRYNKDYSWVKIKDSLAEVGVVEPAAKKVKEFVFIKLPEKGKIIKKGETYVSLEAVKWSGHLSSPLTGKVIEVNDALFDEPSKINKDPYASWIMKIRFTERKEAEALMDGKDATRFYGEKIK